MSISLYELTSEYEQLLLLAEDAVDPDEQQALADTLEGLEGELEQKLLNCAAVVRSLAATEAAIGAEVDRLQKRQATAGNSILRLKDYMLQSMQRAELKRVADARFTVWTQKSPVSVQIADEDALLSPFVTIKTTRSPDKKAIREAIEAGQDVPGCCLERTDGLRIR